ncbi:MAG: lysine--tRNA ligase [Bosea sp. 32-68-6]|nr:MAG: lysine--tRNA ligase [Bosea sp. 32-68-6]
MPVFDPALVDAAQRSAAWPFEEARKLVARIAKSGKQEVIFETGYGPSGLPHIGTFGEVARTSMVRHAFEVLTDGTIPTRLIAFSDDMDGLRKVPDNVPNKALLAANLGKPLTEVPDPFGTHDSFGRHNNARLRAFLDQFGFDYEFKSSTDSYRAGEFDATLLKMLARYDAVMKIMLPTLREEREWKPDWAMRWVALGVDYEMAGKDLIDSVKVSSQIARALDGTPPEGFNYELFLDEQGQKISKSKGNGLTIEQWLEYGPQESLALYMFQRPREAKKLHFDVIPRAVDEYLQFLGGYERQDWKNRLGNPVWHLHHGEPPQPEVIAAGEGDNVSRAQITFGLLMNLVAVANSEDKSVLWGFLQRYAPGISPQTHPRLDALVGYAIAYFRDFVKPAKNYRIADEVERDAFAKLNAALAELPPDATAEMVQDAALDIARKIPRYQHENTKEAPVQRIGVSGEWWKAIYQVLFGEDRGPRFGSFAAIYGLANTRALIAKALSGALVEEHAAFVDGRKG